MRLARLTIAAIALSLAAGVARAEIVVAVAAPLSGSFAVLGAEVRAGVEQAVADVNAAGGVLGQPLRLEVMDDGCDAKIADAVANQLAGKGAAMVVGHFCLGASLAAESVYAANRIVEISPATTYPAYTDARPGPGIFRLAGRDDAQGAVAGKFLATQYAARIIAIVDDNSTYGKGLADAARRGMNAAGKKEVLTQTYQAGATDFSDLVFRLKASNIDVVFIGGFHPEVARIAGEMRAQGMSATIVGGDALMTEEYWRAAGPAADGTRLTFPPDPRRNADAAAVVAAFRDRGVEPEGYVLNAYAALQVWSQAVATAGSLDFEAVVAALAGGSFRSVLGAVSFDSKGDVNLPSFVFYEWKDGGYDYLQM